MNVAAIASLTKNPVDFKAADRDEVIAEMILPDLTPASESAFHRPRHFIGPNETAAVQITAVRTPMNLRPAVSVGRNLQAPRPRMMRLTGTIRPRQD
jgi:hypothetical protein